MEFYYAIMVAFILDFFLGDPAFLPHPIRLMGNCIARFEPYFRKMKISLVYSGGIFAFVLVFGAWVVTYTVIDLATRIDPLLGWITTTIILYYSFALGDLEESAMDVYHALKGRNLALARGRVAKIVGRDVRKLDETNIARATVETVAENFVDGVLSPIFFAIIGGAPLAMAYKMISTLDSMVGYRNEKYIEFGKVSARADDMANYIPARISVLLISIASEVLCLDFKSAFMTAWKEGANHKSPNSGRPEAAFAGALKIRLGGPDIYDGKLIEKAYIGKNFKSVSTNDIVKACDLMLLSSMIWLIILYFIAIMSYLRLLQIYPF